MNSLESSGARRLKHSTGEGLCWYTLGGRKSYVWICQELWESTLRDFRILERILIFGFSLARGR